MHAVAVKVTITDAEAGRAGLERDVVPQTSQAPGFVAGYWMDAGDNQGRAILVFESEDAARAAAEQVQGRADAVTLDSVDVWEVVASA